MGMGWLTCKKPAWMTVPQYPMPLTRTALLPWHAEFWSCDDNDLSTSPTIGSVEEAKEHAPRQHHLCMVCTNPIDCMIV